MTTTTLTRLAYALAFAIHATFFVACYYVGTLVRDLDYWPVALAWVIAFGILYWVVRPVIVRHATRQLDADEALANEQHLARMRDLFGDESEAFARYEESWRARH